MLRQNAGVFLFAAIAVAFIGLIVYARWWEFHGGGKARRERDERRKREREASARARGWQYDGTIDGNIHYRIAGTTALGEAWTIHYDSDQSSSSSTPKLIFHAPNLGAGDFAWTIHDRKTYAIMQKSGVRMVVGGLSKLVGAFSESMRLKRGFYLAAKVLPSGGPEFRERFVLAAVDRKWSALLTGQIERQVLNWPAFKQSMSLRDNCISAELMPEGLRVQLYADAPEFEVIEHMARLGQGLADATLRVQNNESGHTTLAQ